MAAVSGSPPSRQPNPRETGVATLFDGPLWNALRQGARNVAGVRYQLAVTAFLLAESRRGVLPFVELVPEGFEDVDCRDSQSTQWLVQVKEFGAGAGIFTAASLADTVCHAAAAVRLWPARIVAITDGQLGSKVVESGWKKTVTETPGFDIDSTVAALGRRGHRPDEAHALLRATHLVTLPWNTGPLVTGSILRTYRLEPAAAALVACRLMEDVGRLAADQRHAAGREVGRYALGDLDLLVEKTMSVVDVRALNSAVRLGVCAIADYAAKDAVTLATFLKGIDALPAHIGANFDVIRPKPSRAIQQAIDTARYALIAGPSGAGKSTQLWRSARDLKLGAQVIRVHRIETEDEIEELVRYVELLSPGNGGSIVVCCDDLGRPRTRGWPVAVRRLLELPEVILLGAVRQEDFTAQLLRHGGVLVNLHLDPDSARAIADQLQHAGVEHHLEIAEAIRQADGQLMEFVSLLTTGRRLRSVLAAQVEGLLLHEDQTGADIARLVCASHVVGVTVDASSLSAAVSQGEPARVTRALLKLQDEHIITTEDQRDWRGLHQLRSEVLTELLHRTPPPTRTQTLGTVLGILQPNRLGWALRRIVELFGEETGIQLSAVRAAVHRCRDAPELSVLLEGLERADHSVTARSYIPIIERHRRDKVPLLALAFLVCGHKLAGVDFDIKTDNVLAQLARRVTACSSDLPARSTTYCDAAVAELNDSALVRYITRCSLEEAVRLLEATAPYIRLRRTSLVEICSALEWPRSVLSSVDRLLRGRFVDVCYHASRESNAFGDVFGPTHRRLTRACQAHPNVISGVVSAEGTCATVELLADPREEGVRSRLEWDPKPRDEDDPINRRAVELATYIGECCPELEVVEVRTLLADRSSLKIRDRETEWEPGYKRLGRNARPRRSLVRINVGVQGAITRQVASFSWTELIRKRERIAGTVSELATSAPRRLSPRDNERRRAKWRESLEDVAIELTDLPAPPVDKDLRQGAAAVDWDRVPSDDKLTDALKSVVTTLQTLVKGEPKDFDHLRGGAQAGMALGQLRAARSDSELLTTDGEVALYGRLESAVGRLRSLLVAISFDNLLLNGLKGPPSQFLDVVDEFIDQAASHRIGVERRALEAIFGNVVDTGMESVGDETLFPGSIRGHQWVVMVPPVAWEQAVGAAAGFGRDVVKVAVTLVCVHEGVVLPIAVRLSSTNEAVLPVPPGDIADIAGRLALRTVPADKQAFFTGVADELALASWKNARRGLRPVGWPSVPNEDSAREHIRRAYARIDGAAEADGEVVVCLRAIAKMVDEEIGGKESRPLAAAVAVPPSLDGDKGNVDPAADLVLSGALLALDQELREYFSRTTERQNSEE